MLVKIEQLLINKLNYMRTEKYKALSSLSLLDTYKKTIDSLLIYYTPKLCTLSSIELELFILYLGELGFTKALDFIPLLDKEKEAHLMASIICKAPDIFNSLINLQLIKQYPLTKTTLQLSEKELTKLCFSKTKLQMLDFMWAIKIAGHLGAENLVEILLNQVYLRGFGIDYLMSEIIVTAKDARVTRLLLDYFLKVTTKSGIGSIILSLQKVYTYEDCYNASKIFNEFTFHLTHRILAMQLPDEDKVSLVMLQIKYNPHIDMKDLRKLQGAVTANHLKNKLLTTIRQTILGTILTNNIENIERYLLNNLVKMNDFSAEILFSKDQLQSLYPYILKIKPQAKALLSFLSLHRDFGSIPPDAEGNNALHLAVKENNSLLYWHLFVKDATLDRANLSGESPFDSLVYGRIPVLTNFFIKYHDLSMVSTEIKLSKWGLIEKNTAHYLDCLEGFIEAIEKELPSLLLSDNLFSLAYEVLQRLLFNILSSHWHSYHLNSSEISALLVKFVHLVNRSNVSSLHTSQTLILLLIRYDNISLALDHLETNKVYLNLDKEVLAVVKTSLLLIKTLGIPFNQFSGTKDKIVFNFVEELLNCTVFPTLFIPTFEQASSCEINQLRELLEMQPIEVSLKPNQNWSIALENKLTNPLVLLTKILSLCITTYQSSFKQEEKQVALYLLARKIKQYIEVYRENFGDYKESAQLEHKFLMLDKPLGVYFKKLATIAEKKFSSTLVCPIDYSVLEQDNQLARLSLYYTHLICLAEEMRTHITQLFIIALKDPTLETILEKTVLHKKHQEFKSFLGSFTELPKLTLIQGLLTKALIAKQKEYCEHSITHLLYLFANPLPHTSYVNLSEKKTKIETQIADNKKELLNTTDYFSIKDTCEKLMTLVEKHAVTLACMKKVEPLQPAKLKASSSSQEAVLQQKRRIEEKKMQENGGANRRFEAANKKLMELRKTEEICQEKLQKISHKEQLITKQLKTSLEKERRLSRQYSTILGKNLQVKHIAFQEKQGLLKKAKTVYQSHQMQFAYACRKSIDADAFLKVADANYERESLELKKAEAEEKQALERQAISTLRLEKANAQCQVARDSLLFFTGKEKEKKTKIKPSFLDYFYSEKTFLIQRADSDHLSFGQLKNGNACLLAVKENLFNQLQNLSEAKRHLEHGLSAHHLLIKEYLLDKLSKAPINTDFSKVAKELQESTAIVWIRHEFIPARETGLALISLEQTNICQFKQVLDNLILNIHAMIELQESETLRLQTQITVLAEQGLKQEGGGEEGQIYAFLKNQQEFLTLLKVKKQFDWFNLGQLQQSLFQQKNLLECWRSQFFNEVHILQARFSDIRQILIRNKKVIKRETFLLDWLINNYMPEEIMLNTVFQEQFQFIEASLGEVNNLIKTLDNLLFNFEQNNIHLLEKIEDVGLQLKLLNQPEECISTYLNRV